MDSALKIRKHLTPPSGIRAAFNDMRREVRREVSERVSLQSAGQGFAVDGWTLNVSRGGVRVIIERPVGLGEVLDVTVGTDSGSQLVRQGRVVWFQEEADGYIVGIAFVAPRSLQQ